MDDQQRKDEQDQTVESGSDENPESGQSKYIDQNYEIPLINTQAVPLEEDMENCEINSKLGLGFTPRPKLRKPIPKPRKTLVVSKQ